MNTPDPLRSIEIYPLSIPRDTPYLGPLENDLKPNARGYFVRPGNRSVYSTRDHSVLVKLTTASGLHGWGECVTVVAPGVVVEILRDLIWPMIEGRDPQEVVAIYEDLYDAMRVRGFFGGFYHDAIAAVDIALWDLKGKLCGLPVSRLLGAQRHTSLPAYVSGLPCPTLAERAALAKDWAGKGFPAIKFAAAVSHEGITEEMAALREAVGPACKLLIDMHWKFSAGEAIQLITELEQHKLYVAEAPVRPEDTEGQARVARAVKTPVAIGEELRTAYECRPKFEAGCMDILQPEMGRTGITAFWFICQMAKTWNVRVMPHASIGIGIFQAASLQVSAALTNCPMHEYQHSIFDRYLPLLDTTMSCQAGAFTVPTSPGLGVEVQPEALKYATQ